MRPHYETAVRDAGLGLTELLVSLALLALISLLILQGIGAGQSLWRRMAGYVEGPEAVQDAQTALRERMERIYPATKRDLQLAYPDVEGTDTSLVFIAPADAAHSPDALRRYTLHVSTSGDLVLDSRSDLWRNMTISIVPPPMDEVLLHGVRGITLSYFDGATRGGVWLPSWHQRPYMPALIRLKLAFSVGDRRWWPTFLVHPLATIDTGCVLNRATGSCSGRL